MEKLFSISRFNYCALNFTFKILAKGTIRGNDICNGTKQNIFDFFLLWPGMSRITFDILFRIFSIYGYQSS